MSIIHRTTLKPTKPELLTPWLPTRPWYRGGGAPQLAKAGGFRLDDPRGEVGIEFFVATDAQSPTDGQDATDAQGPADAQGPHAYLFPLTYRGAELPGADHALVGTLEHGVLGRRWVYDGVHDPVLTSTLTAFLAGRVEAQAQSTNDTVDEEIAHACTAEAPLLTGAVTVTDTPDGTTLTTPDGPAVHFHRLLTTAPTTPPPHALGHITGAWTDLTGHRVRGVFAVIEQRD
ncbi:1,4-alpha-glucan branching protein [Streptomyces roseirectus]|uniref:1,4-alpha-glucan branching protein n=1 Tax=Streptomyces roseirectus TaxID=2768066 RepID=A0A7H0IRJ7_9ACTN|nr:1,4-alpha-glucan branching protein [Streptomyces roseirectus]QNP75413.1 1,4-alpha-glucan branching protein [Streptomyces roseirectus]